MGCSDDALLCVFSWPAQLVLCSALVLGSIDIALLQAPLIWTKSWTPRKTNIITAIVVTISTMFTVSASIPFGAIPSTTDSAVHHNTTGNTTLTETYTTGYLNISEKQKTMFDITILFGTTSVFIPVLAKLPSSGMVNMFLAQIGVYVAIPDIIGFVQWEIDRVVISSLFFPVISSLLSVIVFIGIKKVVLSKPNPNDFLQGYLPSILALLAVESTVSLLQQQFICE